MKRLASDSVIYGLGSVANQALAIVLLPLYTRYLTPSDYGALALINTAGGILVFSAALGIHSGMVRIFFKYPEAEERRRVASTALFFAVAMASASVALLHLSRPWIVPLIFDFPDADRYYGIAAWTFSAAAVNSTSLAILQVYQRPRPYVVCSLTGLLVSVGLSIYLVAFAGMGLLGVLTGQLVGILAQLVLGVAASSSNLRLAFDRGAVREMLEFCVPLWPTNVSAWVLTMADRWMLNAFSTLASVGLYALGFRFGMVLDTLFIRPFQQAWSPHLFSSLGQPDYREMIARVLEYYVFLGGMLALAIGLFAGDAIRIIATPAYFESERVVFWIAAGALLRGTTTITVASIHIETKTHYSSYVYGGAMGLNLTLLWLLVPRFGILGAASSVLITYGGVTCAFLWIASVLHPIPYRLAKTGGALAAAVAIYCVSRFVPPVSDVSNLAMRALLLASFPVGLWLAGYFRERDLDAVLSFARAKLARRREP